MRGTVTSERGLTLLEVMIALAIVAIALTVLLGLANRSLKVNERLHRLTRATLLAQEKLAEISTRHGSLNAEEGVCDPPFEDYRWKSAYSEMPLPSIRRVDVTVRWGEAKLNEEVTLTSFVRGG